MTTLLGPVAGVLSGTHRAAFAVADALRLPLPDQSVDLVVCSPPYEGARTYGIGFKLDGQAWVEWAITRYLESLRVCRGLVVWVVAGTTDNYRWSATPALLMAGLHRHGVYLRNPPIFHRVGIPGSGGPDWLRADYEWCICATARRGKLPWSDNTAMGHAPKYGPGGAMSHRLSDGTRRNQWGGTPTLSGQRKPSGGRGKAERPSHRLTITREREGMHRQGVPYAPPAKANPGNVIKLKVGGGLMGSKLAHENEAPFPESLVNFYVRSFCPPGGIVLDPFSGSGTTVAAALKAGRRGIGFDVRESQVKLGERRMGEIRATAEKASGLS